MSASSHRIRILTIVEDAERGSACVCGAHMIVASDADGLWLECSELGRPRRGRLARFLALLAHERRLLLAADELGEVDGEPAGPDGRGAPRTTPAAA